MNDKRLIGLLCLILMLALGAALLFGETALTPDQYLAAVTDRGSAPFDILFGIRAPRAAMAALIGAALGVSGAVMQALLRNPLADPGVLGVSAFSGLGAALALVTGLAVVPGAVELGAFAGAIGAGALIAVAAVRLKTPEALILFGIALSAFGGALTSLVFNLSPSPIATAEILSWLLGSVANRDWTAVLVTLGPVAMGAGLCGLSGRGLRMLTLGEEVARLSGLPMTRLRLAALAGTALMTGASVAAAGVVGFIGIAAPHALRALVGDDPARSIMPSGLAGAIMLVLADLLARALPFEQELRLGVVTALFGAPLFGLIAWRAAQSWRA